MGYKSFFPLESPLADIIFVLIINLLHLMNFFVSPSIFFSWS